MRKAGLLDRPPLTATRGMLAAAIRDPGVIRYFRAKMSANAEILEVDLFTGKDLAADKREPRFRIFLDRGRDDFASWNTVEEKWSSAKIDMLETGDCGYTYYRCRNHAAKETLNTVNRYLGTGNMQDVETAVAAFQAKIRKRQLDRKRRLVTDIIDGYMNTVPDRLPADWMRFINDRVLEPAHCIVFKRREKQGYCTHCMRRVPVPGNARHNMPGKCTCGSRITYKSWQKQKSIVYATRASVLMKCTDGQNRVYRQFYVRMRMMRGKDYVPEITAHEDYRQIFFISDEKGGLKSVGDYEWGVFGSTGMKRWCRAGTVKHGCFCGGSYGYGCSVLYTANMTKLLKGTKLQYIPAADIVKGMGPERIDVMAVLGDMGNGFPYEAFWKMGLKRFVKERVFRGGTEGRAGTDRCADKPWKYLKMSKADMNRAVRLDADDRQMRVIQLTAESGVSLADEQVRWLGMHAGADALLGYFSVHTPHRIIRYLKERVKLEECEAGGNDNLQLWKDYINTARQLGWSLSDGSVFFPQNIRRAHDEAVRAFTLREDREDAEEMRLEDMKMHRNARQIKKAFCYRDDEFMLKVPGNYLEFKHEGLIQHNCVATYFKKAVQGECIIVFIRRRKTPDRPFCTVEIRNDHGSFTVVQNRSAYNKAAPEDAERFLTVAVRAAQRIADNMAGEEKKKGSAQEQRNRRQIWGSLQ